MWRLKGFVGRVFNRCYSNAPLRLSQNHHVEDEVINGSTVTGLSNSRNTSDSSSQRGEHEGKRGKQNTSQFCYAELPPYTALEAVGWGAAAVLFMQICRRIHSQLSSGPEVGPSSASAPGPLATPSVLHKCGYRVLIEILSQHNVLPRAREVMCLKVLPEGQDQVQPQVQIDNNSSNSSISSCSQASHHSSTDQEQLTDDSSLSDHQRAERRQDSLLQEEQPWLTSSHHGHPHTKEDSTQTFGDNYKEGERLAGAALNLKHVADSSVPVILNIIGLESAKRKNYGAAFSCFVVAAQHGYGKALFNTGVCYERGWGVGKDGEKALHYYWQAAVGGHVQAQYRYAKLLLTSRGQQSPDEWKTAISLLEQAATAGHTKAQVLLGSVFSQEPVRDGCKSVHYLKMASEGGDSTAQLHLGQCYESGFGVQQNTKTAMGFYKAAARAGNSQAKNLLRLQRQDETVLRSICSAPSFSAMCRLPRQLPSTATGPDSRVCLPHSWSTGSLASTPLHLHPQAPSSAGGHCQWTLEKQPLV